MKPSELTATVVRQELEHLIKSYPERTGTILMGHWELGDDSTCVYYADEDGMPISVVGMHPEDIAEVNSAVLKTPVCIVGQWIEDFHPEFKEDGVIREVLVRNSTMRHATVPFSPDVHELLKRAQDQQDMKEGPWGTIDLDKEDAW